MCLYLNQEQILQHTQLNDKEIQHMLDYTFNDSKNSEKINNSITQAIQKNILNFPPIQIEEAQKKWNERESDFNVSQFIKPIYHFDQDKGLGILLPEDDKNFRFNHSVDWFENSKNQDMQFCAKRIYGNYFNGEIGMMFEGNKTSKLKSNLNPQFYNISTMKDIYQQAYDDSPENLSMTEFYQKMEYVGFSSYINPLYFIMLHASGPLHESVDINKIKNELNVHIITSWS